ncbi:unnamed protein product [Prunus armeniaca]
MDKHWSQLNQMRPYANEPLRIWGLVQWRHLHHPRPTITTTLTLVPLASLCRVCKSEVQVEVPSSGATMIRQATPMRKFYHAPGAWMRQ